MSISKSFEASVKNESIDVVRSILINSLITDRTFKKFDEELEYAKNIFNDIIQDGDEVELNLDKTTWNDSYCGLVSFELLSNFSLKRINHLKEVLIEIHGEPELVDNRQDNVAKTEVQKSSGVIDKTYSKIQGNSHDNLNIKSSNYYDNLNAFVKKYPNLEKQQINRIMKKHFKNYIQNILKNIDVELESLNSNLNNK